MQKHQIVQDLTLTWRIIKTLQLSLLLKTTFYWLMYFYYQNLQLYAKNTVLAVDYLLISGSLFSTFQLNCMTCLIYPLISHVTLAKVETVKQNRAKELEPKPGIAQPSSLSCSVLFSSSSELQHQSSTPVIPHPLLLHFVWRALLGFSLEFK